MSHESIKAIAEAYKSMLSEKKEFDKIDDAVFDVIDNEKMAKDFNKSNKPTVRQTRQMIDMVAKRMGYKSSSDLSDDKDDEVREVLMNVINNKKK